MRCMACGAEMLLMSTVQDDTMAVSGFQHQTFMCSSCHDVERRLVFAKDEQAGATAQATVAVETSAAEPTGAEPEPEHAAPPISPIATLPSVAAEQIERAPTTGVLRRVFARLRGG